MSSEPEPLPDATAARLHALEQQVHWLTWQVAQLQQARPQPPGGPSWTPGPAATGGSPSQAPTSAAAPVPPRPVQSAARDDDGGAERWVLRAGVLLLVIGLAYLFRYSIERGWLTQHARLVFGALLATGLAGAGTWRIAARPLFGSLMQAGGVVAAFVTIGAACRLYELLPVSTGWWSTIAVGLAGLAATARWRQPAPGLLATLGGLTLLLLLPAFDVAPTTVQVYSPLLLFVGGLAAAAFVPARALLWTTVLSTLGCVLILAGITVDLQSESMDPAWALWFVAAASVAGAFALARPERTETFDLALLGVAVPSAAWAAHAFIWELEPGTMAPLGASVAVGLGALFGAGRALGVVSPAVAAASVGALVTAAVAATDGLTWLVGPLAAAGAWHVAAARPDHGMIALPAWLLSLVGGTVFAFSLGVYLESPTTEPAHVGTWLIALAVLGATAWFARRGPSGAALLMQGYAAFLATSVAVLYPLPGGTVASTFVWAVLSVALLTLGIRRRTDVLRQFGLLTLALLVAKVLYWDLQALETIWRVLALMGMGLLFLGFGYAVPGLLRNTASAAPAQGQPPEAADDLPR